MTERTRRARGRVRTIGREVAAFGVVGAVAFVAETAAFNLLVLHPASGGGWGLAGAPVVASGLATLLAMAVSWFGNRYWTYRDRRGPVDRREVLTFVAVNLVGLAVTAVPVYVSREWLGLASPLSYNVARLIGWAVATVLRFTVYRTLVFVRPEEACARPPGAGGRWNALVRGVRRGGTSWPWWLAAVAAFCGYAVATVFHPGYLSADSTDQLRQALGERPTTDWHPPVLVLLWRMLLGTTGSVGAMAALQAAVLWGSLWVLALVMWRRTGSRGLSLAVLAVGLAPQVMNLTGVVWKDVHMAYALLAACAVAFTAREVPPGRSRTRWTLLVLGVLCLAYAVLVRKNAFLAVIPVFVLLVLALWPAPGRRRWSAATGVLLAVTLGGSVAVSLATTPVATRQYTQIPLDDLVHVLTPAQVRAAAEKAGADGDFRDRVTAAALTCRKNGAAADAYFRCYPRDLSRGTTELSGHTDVVVRMWTQQMPKHWTGYAEYRLRVFAGLLFQGTQSFQNGTYPGALQRPAVTKAPNDTLRAALQSYVTGSARDLPFLFQGWFWLAVAAVLALRRRWPGPYTRELRLLGTSAVLYILAYLPTAPASNYRYIYWPALAGTLGLLLIAAAVVTRRRAAPPEGAFARPATGAASDPSQRRAHVGTSDQRGPAA
ncbi:GtrA family protein [Streptomyces bauhiniae]|uniref:GtrA family protein n=1 Tax=Streptomyces bauhiniae TaxID=2340725 RepID=UPI0037D43AA0